MRSSIASSASIARISAPSAGCSAAAAAVIASRAGTLAATTSPPPPKPRRDDGEDIAAAAVGRVGRVGRVCRAARVLLASHEETEAVCARRGAGGGARVLGPNLRQAERGALLREEVHHLARAVEGHARGARRVRQRGGGRRGGARGDRRGGGERDARGRDRLALRGSRGAHRMAADTDASVASARAWPATRAGATSERRTALASAAMPPRRIVFGRDGRVRSPCAAAPRAQSTSWFRFRLSRSIEYLPFDRLSSSTGRNQNRLSVSAYPDGVRVASIWDGDRAGLHCPPRGAAGVWVERVAMAETTPQKQQASARLLQVGVDEDHLDGSAYPEGVSRTPGSPTKLGGRTMWTKADDDEDATNGASAVGVSGTNGESESEPVIKQVTHTDSLAAPVYGTRRAAHEFQARRGRGRARRGSDLRRRRRRNSRGFSVLHPARKEDRNDEVRRATRDESRSTRIATNDEPDRDC